LSDKLVSRAGPSRCFTCSGLGTINREQCQSCHGTGTAATVPGGQDCILCEASGVYKRFVVSSDGKSRQILREERCLTCNGTGRVAQPQSNSRVILPRGWAAILPPES
jgi:DnaJ-class molecular chaperone